MQCFASSVAILPHTTSLLGAYTLLDIVEVSGASASVVLQNYRHDTVPCFLQKHLIKQDRQRVCDWGPLTRLQSVQTDTRVTVHPLGHPIMFSG